MPAADDEPNAREDVPAGREAAGVDMAGDVIHTDERHTEPEAEHLRRGDADEQRANQPRRVVNRDAADICKRDPRLCEGLIDDWQEVPQMGT